MTFLAWLAAFVLFLQLPIPLYWFVMHPQVNYWRRHRSAGYATGLLLSWLPVTILLVMFRHDLFRSDRAPAWQIIAGIALLIFEVWIFRSVSRDLGSARLVGQTELAGGGELESRGIYARLRHPRYTASFLAILGACLLAGTRVTWIVAAVWLALTRTVIAFEEHELRDRFGAAYEEYCRRVPRFFPLLAKPRAG